MRLTTEPRGIGYSPSPVDRRLLWLCWPPQTESVQGCALRP